MPGFADMAKLMLREMTFFYMVHNNVILFSTFSYIWREVYFVTDECHMSGAKLVAFSLSEH